MPAPAAKRMHDPRGVEITEISASDAKNTFGNVLDRVNREGAVAITKHDKACAVLVSVERYESMTATPARVLDDLTREFDALCERMQQPGMRAAMQKAFDMSPVELGRVAVGAAVSQGGKASAGVAKSRGSRSVKIIERRTSLEAKASRPAPTARERSSAKSVRTRAGGGERGGGG